MTAPEYSNSIKAFEKAADAIENAKYNLEGGYFVATANRSYYACYYSLIALLYTKDVYSKTHQGAQVKFAELFIKPGVLPVEVSDIITLLFNYRQEVDYDLDADITKEEAEMVVLKATEMYHLCKAHFEKILKS